MLVILIAIAACVSTYIGGIFALRAKDKLHLILGFSAGAVVAVAFFDLLPEALELSQGSRDSSAVLMWTAFGFLFYLVLDRLLFFHAHHQEEEEEHIHHHRGYLGAAALVTHSFLDGVAIGLAFQVSAAIGIVVAIAVLVHDFSDGINTVGLVRKAGGGPSRARRWLFLGAIAPVLGAFSTLFFTLPASALGIILAVFAGFFFYIGASDLIPESHHVHPTMLTTVMTLLGALVLFGAIQVAHI